MNRYEVLHYRGDVTADISEGELFGTDELGRPYAVIDAEFDGERTTVHLQYATPEQIAAVMQAGSAFFAPEVSS